MKERILTTIFTLGFILTGCGIDSAFDEGSLVFWVFCFGVTAVCGYILFCKKGE